MQLSDSAGEKKTFAKDWMIITRNTKSPDLAHVRRFSASYFDLDNSLYYISGTLTTFCFVLERFSEAGSF